MNWKFEGDADYVARQNKNDGLLRKKDETKQIFSNCKYAIVDQYLSDVKNLDYEQFCVLDTPLD